MQNRKHHFQVWYRRETKAAEYSQLKQLKEREQMDLSLRDRAHVVIRRVGVLADTNKS